jgi:hypothetical protein
MRWFLGRKSRAVVLCCCAMAVCAELPRSDPLAREWKNPPKAKSQENRKPTETFIEIPGPLRSFVRMAGISAEAPRDEVLPDFGHFVETYGYGGSKARSPQRTEAMILFDHYFAQAEALAKFAGPSGRIHFSTCEEAKPLLKILGYRLRGRCEGSREIEVGEPARAFVTVDSGFPLADLQEDLLEQKPFTMRYGSTRLPLIFSARDWTGQRKADGAQVVTRLAGDPALARLYWALSRMDGPTRELLRRSLGVKRMLAFASVLDFYGSTLVVRDGRVAVPGGRQAEREWARLAGADPGRPEAFILHLLRKDRGSLAEYYDAIARAPLPQERYFAKGDHLRVFYAAFQGHDTSDDAVRSTFRPGAELLLLTARLPVEADGEPLIPGGLQVWKEAFRRRPASKIGREWASRALGWTRPEQLVEGLFALSRSYSDDGPLQMYLVLSEIDRQRAPGERMSAATARLMITHFAELRDQYEIFSEFPELNQASIAEFIGTTQKIDGIRNPLVRGDAMGLFEANIGLWQIFARQGQINGDLNESWQRTIAPFGQARTEAQLFDSGRQSLTQLMQAVTGEPEIDQQELVNLLAGPEQESAEGQAVHDRIAGEIQQVMADQRLVSLDTLLALGDDFHRMGKGAKGADVQRGLLLAEQLKEARGPRPMFTEAERDEWVPGERPNAHIQEEMKTDPQKLLSRAEQEGGAACAALTPYLRDTLVGLNYAYYQPPGSQVLHDSPLLVRSQDFLASESIPSDEAWLAPRFFGAGLAAAGGVHLSGSLAGLPYVLAEMQEDLIVPKRVQELIWKGVAADMLVSATIPRWWSTPAQDLHAAALYQKAGEEIVAAGAKDAALRTIALGILSDQLLPATIDSVERDLRAGDAKAALDRISPEAAFHLAAEFQRRFPGRMAKLGPAGSELASMVQQNPNEGNAERLSKEFGVPHPNLTGSYRDDLLDVKLFPSAMGYASDLLAESWESTNLYWARLADEMGDSPVMLNELAPRLASQMVRNIASTDFDDWPALNRALRETGREFLASEGNRTQANAALQQPEQIH